MIHMLGYQHKDKIAQEVRPAYFLKAFNKPVENMRIFSFGNCNFNCPYCKRDGQFRDKDGNIINAVPVEMDYLLNKVGEVVQKGQTVRLSGGDPVMYPRTSLEVLQHAKSLGGRTSIAHNGSSPKFISMLLPYLDYAAIDLKAGSPEEFSLRTGLSNSNNQLGGKMLKNSLRVQEILSQAGVMVDVRTCVFSTTTLDDLLYMAGLIYNSGCPENKFWTIRIYKPVTGCSWSPAPVETILQYLDIVKKQYPGLRMGMRAKWEPGGFMYL